MLSISCHLNLFSEYEKFLYCCQIFFSNESKIIFIIFVKFSVRNLFEMADWNVWEPYKCLTWIICKVSVKIGGFVRFLSTNQFQNHTTVSKIEAFVRFYPQSVFKPYKVNISEVLICKVFSFKYLKTVKISNYFNNSKNHGKFHFSHFQSTSIGEKY